MFGIASHEHFRICQRDRRDQSIHIRDRSAQSTDISGDLCVLQSRRFIKFENRNFSQRLVDLLTLCDWIVGQFDSEQQFRHVESGGDCRRGKIRKQWNNAGPMLRAASTQVDENGRIQARRIIPADDYDLGDRRRALRWHSPYRD